MAADTDNRLREIAAEFDYLIESDVKVVTDYTDKTLERQRKDRLISYVYIGKNRFYPKEQFARPEAVRKRVQTDSAKTLLGAAA